MEKYLGGPKQMRLEGWFISCRNGNRQIEKQTLCILNRKAQDDFGHTESRGNPS